MDLDWVKRKALGEQILETQKEDVWRGLCAALDSAINSYRKYYGGAAEGHLADEHRYWISVASKPPYQDAVIEVTFAPPEIRVVCSMGQCKTSRYVLNPNTDAPFVNHDGKELSIDQLSESILHCTFFPAERRGVRPHTVVPCSA